MKKVKESKKDREKNEFFLFTIIRNIANKYKIAKPRTTPQIIHTFFKDFNEKNSINKLLVFI